MFIRSFEDHFDRLGGLEFKFDHIDNFMCATFIVKIAKKCQKG